MTRTDQGFPKVSEPIVDPKSGLINQTWLQLLITLWNRTGGPSGSVDRYETNQIQGALSDVQNRLTQLETPSPETSQFLGLFQQIQDAVSLVSPDRPVTSIQGRSVSGASPSDSNVLAWNASTKEWEPQAASSGGVLPLVTGTTPGPDLIADPLGQCIGVPL
jgi:hypothetical protein